MPHLSNVMTYAQLAEAGVSTSAVRHRLTRGEWQRPLPGVIVTHSGTLTRREQLEAALAYAGPSAVLSHRTAAEILQLGFPTAERVILTIPHEQRIVRGSGFTAHRSRLLTPEHITTRAGLPCTTVERTVVDLADATPKASRALAVIADAVGSQRTTTQRILDQVALHNRLRHRAVIQDALAETRAGARSYLEVLHARICRNHGLPIGTRQRRFEADGRVFFVDEVVEDYGLVTELDGHLGHEKLLERFRDMDRDNFHIDAGRLPIRLGWEDVLDRPCEVARRRASNLRRLGWTGTVQSCGIGCSATDPMTGNDHVA